MKKIIIGVIVLIIIGAAFLANRTKSKQAVEGSPLKIGISLPLTGSIAHFGESAKKGVELADEELKRDHPDLHFKYYIEDNAFTGKNAVSAYRKLKDADQVNAIITASSPATLATQPLADKDGLLQMGIFSSTPKYSTPDDLAFRIFPRADKEADALLEYLQKKQLERFAILYIANDFGQGVFDSMNAKLTSGNNSLKLVVSDSYTPDTTDFRTLLTKIKQTDPQALLMVATARDAVSMMRQARELNFHNEFLAPSSASDPAVLGTINDTEGLLVTDIFDPESADEGTKNFVNSFKQKFGIDPDVYAVQGYDGYKLTALALAKCSHDGECLKSYLMGLKDYPTVLGSLTYDINGDPDYKYFVKLFTNKHFERVKE